MTTSSTVQFLSPEEIATRNVGEAAHLKFADLAFVFRDRALRLRQLAAGHPMRDFLIFMADVADAQHTVLNAPRCRRRSSSVTRRAPVWRRWSSRIGRSTTNGGTICRNC